MFAFLHIILYSLITTSSSKKILSLAIEQISNSIINTSYNIELTEGLLAFKPDMTFLSIPKCNSIESDSTHVTHSNCLILVICYLKLVISNDYTINNLYLMELKFSSMDYKYASNKLNVKLHYDSCNYNRKTPLASSMVILGSFDKLINSACKKLADEYSKTIEMEAGVNSSSALFGDLVAVFNILSMGGPFFDKKINEKEDILDQVTFYAFKEAIIHEALSLRDRILVKKIIVPFEYSIDCDLNYKEGSVIIDDITMTEVGIKAEKTAVNLEYPDNSEVVKNYIQTQFEERIKDSLIVYQIKIMEIRFLFNQY